MCKPLSQPPPPPGLGAVPALGLTLPGLASTVMGLAAMQLIRLAGVPGAAPHWLAASTTFALGAMLVLGAMRRSYPHARFGSCNAVTLLRMAMVCALAVPVMAGSSAGWLIAGIASLALALDGVDGALARRSGLASRFGARFDMEVDAALALVLALHAYYGAALGVWVLILGVMRYAFVAAGLLLPWLRADLPQRFRRKLICVMQLAALIVLQLPDLAPAPARLIAGGATTALLWSFAVDILDLWRRRA